MNGTRVLVTGASGFIGSHLVRRLLADGADVTVVVRYSSVMKNPRLQDMWERVGVIEADLRNRGALVAVRDAAPQIVFHLAAYNHVGQSFGQVEECFDVNAKGTANLLDACGDAPRFVYLSTSEVYGAQDSVPFVETMEPHPMSPYSITKYAGELYCGMRQRLRPEQVVVLRAFNTFGPWQSTKAVIPELILACLEASPVRTTKGEQTREFNFVEDIVDGIVRAGLHRGALPGPVNLAAGQEIAIRDLVRRIAELTGATDRVEIGALPTRPNEIWRMYADATRARTELGWQPRTGFDDGLRRTVEWFREYVAERGRHHG